MVVLDIIVNHLVHLPDLEVELDQDLDLLIVHDYHHYVNNSNINLPQQE